MPLLPSIHRLLRAGSGAVLVLALAQTDSADAQTITNGNSAFVMSTANTIGAAIRTGTDGGVGAALVAGGDSTDQLYQQWWWFRVEGVDTREYALSTRVSNVAGLNSLTATFNEPEGFTAIVHYVIADGGDSPASCVLSADVTLQTNRTTPMQIAFFGYVDLDLEGAPFDGALRQSGGRIVVTDQGSGYFAEITASTANSYMVGAYPTVLNLLTNDGVDNLSNSGSPLAPADFSGCFQWNVTISQGHPVSLPLTIALNASTDPCPGQLIGDANCDGAFNNFDIDCFVLALVGGEGEWNSNCNFNGNCLYSCVLDVNRDGRVDNFDIDPFVTCVVSLGCP